MKNNRNRKQKPSNSQKEKQSGILQELSHELLEQPFHMELGSNREAIIEGSMGILQYDENIIKLGMGQCVTVFRGRNLHIQCMTSSSVIIKGFITGIEFMV
ncbi:MAG: YabP/YqfC family sporulation protein [Oscillospiraceae bacterium]